MRFDVENMAMAASRCPLLGDGITDDTLLHIARFLPTVRDLLCLMLTNTRFAAKLIAAARPASDQQGWGQQRQRRRCCASSPRRRGGCGWRGAASRSVAGCLGLSSRADWV